MSHQHPPEMYAHVRHLYEEGYSTRAIARIAGVCRATVESMLRGTWCPKRGTGQEARQSAGRSAAIALAAARKRAARRPTLAYRDNLVVSLARYAHRGNVRRWGILGEELLRKLGRETTAERDLR